MSAVEGESRSLVFEPLADHRRRPAVRRMAHAAVVLELSVRIGLFLTLGRVDRAVGQKTRSRDQDEGNDEGQVDHRQRALRAGRNLCSLRHWLSGESSLDAPLEASVTRSSQLVCHEGIPGILGAGVANPYESLEGITKA